MVYARQLEVTGRFYGYSYYKTQISAHNLYDTFSLRRLRFNSSEVVKHCIQNKRITIHSRCAIVRSLVNPVCIIQLLASTELPMRFLMTTIIVEVC
jgi:hypothetical protein